VVGNISGNIASPGANTQIIFNDNNIANANSALTFNKSTAALTANGTITGGNIATAGTLSVGGTTTITGNLIVGGTTEYNNVTTLAIQDPIINIGRGPNNDPLLSNDGKDRGEALYWYDTSEKIAFIGYDNSAGKLLAATSVTILNEVVTGVAAYGSMVLGGVEAQGAITSTTTVSATGNVTGGNVITGGFATVSGNVTGGNVNTAGLVSATGNVTGGNVVASARVSGTSLSVSGNVNGGNVISAALTSTASLSVTGNTATVTSANYTIGYRDLPQITAFGTLTGQDGGKHYYGSGTITIPTNASVAFTIGTAILVIASASTTISPAGGVSLLLAGTGTTGARTLAQYGQASLIKVASDTWYISGTGIT
jgi:hypothetical protein